MKLTAAQVEELEKDWLEANVIRPGDHLADAEAGDYWEQFLCFSNQVRGYYYYTNELMIFLGGFMGSTTWTVRYQDIKEIKKCNVALFIPTGVRITCYDAAKGKNVKYKMSVLKRKDRIRFLQERTGLTD